LKSVLWGTSLWAVFYGKVVVLDFPSKQLLERNQIRSERLYNSFSPEQSLSLVGPT